MEEIQENFWAVNWGPDEAKGDTQLGKYFLKIPEYDDLKNGKYRYVIGRKGTGKTAIIEQLTNEVSSQYDCSYKYLSLKNFPIQTLRGLKDRSLGDKSQFVPIWTFLILTEVCKLIIRDEQATPSESITDLKQFIIINFPSDLGFTETLKSLESRENKVSVLSKWVGIEDSSNTSSEIITSVHYQKATEILTTFIKSINTKCKYYLLFDELDEGYSSNDKGLNLLLLALFRAVENTYLDLKDFLYFRPVLALRSDIFNNLEDNDLNKLDDYIINLKWTKEYKSTYSIYDLINARINASIKVKNPNSAWECISVNDDTQLPEKVRSLWDFIYNRTFERPRDLVKFMKYCSRLRHNGRINFQAVRSAEIDYSEWFYKEFRDEIQSHLGVWQEATQSIIKLNKGIFSLDEIKSEFDKDTQISVYLKNQNKKHEDILELLFNFGLIGTLSNTNRWFFKYKDHNLPFNYDQKMIVHFGFARKFRIRVY
ncbi:MAG: hypothetical protein KBB37_07230 [Bacteroidia bacterium]|nr:hypothetical protein [Bacteroidia bacterium]MBP7261062.1 hypothetical protein [Bacteroidia bacterium]MBP9178987.1 hypothetical protein [Bacteroidia bacterium]